MGEELIYFNIPSAYGLSDRVVQELLSHFVSYKEVDGGCRAEIIWYFDRGSKEDSDKIAAMSAYMKHFTAVGHSASENLYLVNPTAATELYGVEAKVKMDESCEYKTCKVLLRPENVSLQKHFDNGKIYTRIIVTFGLLERTREK